MEGDGVAIADFRGMQSAQWIGLIGCGAESARRSILLYGVASSRERARCLALGFGDVVPRRIGIDEIEARAQRILANSGMIAGTRELGVMELDLMSRDAIVWGKRAGLHPREFALLWRLSQTSDIPVSKRELIADVWKSRHVPDTNSLAVHVFRLRTKLSLAGLSNVIKTTEDGAYRLDSAALACPTPPHVLPSSNLISTVSGTVV